MEKLTPASQSESVRALFRTHGIEIPAPGVLSRRGRSEVLAFEVDGAQAIETWERLRAVTDQTGYYPLVIHDEHGMLAELVADSQSPEEVLRAADSTNVQEWLNSQRAEFLGEDGESVIPRKEGASGETVDGYTVPFDPQTGRARPGVFMALFPTRAGHEFPAFLGYGSWNACPDPHIHVAMMKHWNETYGAEPVTLGGDVIEMRVRSRPTNAGEAMALAEEQYLYCCDIVDQGVGYVDALADSLMRSTVWFFWWD